MKVLIADDEPVSRVNLSNLCKNWGYDPVVVEDGSAAWDLMQSPDCPPLALLDWQMPGFTGEELCRRARSELSEKPLHIILITATRLGLQNKVTGLEAGAYDFVTKDYEAAELEARLMVGQRLVSLQTELRKRVAQLEQALNQVHQLQGLLPICMDCKKIRDDQNYWHAVERYIAARADVAFTHSLCPHCLEERLLQMELQV